MNSMILQYIITYLKIGYLYISPVASIPLNFISKYYSECIITMVVGLFSTYIFTRYIAKNRIKGLSIRFLLCLLPIILLGIWLYPGNAFYSSFQNLCNKYRSSYFANSKAVYDIEDQISSSEKLLKSIQKKIKSTQTRHNETNYNIDWIQYQYYLAFFNAVREEKERLETQRSQQLQLLHETYRKLGFDVLIISES